MLKEGFKFFQVWPDQFSRTNFVNDGFLRLQAMPCNTEDDTLISRYATAVDQFLCTCHSHPSGSLRENTFGFCQKFDCFNDFLIGAIFGCAAGFFHWSDGVRAIGLSSD